MAKGNNVTYLRRWEFSRGSEPSLSDLKLAFKEMLIALNSDIHIREEDSTLIFSGPSARYMSVVVDSGTVDGKPVVDMAVSGKGEQIKAPELEKYYEKSLGAMNRFLNSMGKADAWGQLFRTRGAAFGVGAVVGATIGGGVRLVAKGVKALLRDQEAYKKELAFYIRVMGIGDFVVGGKDSDGLISIIADQAKNNNTMAQYTLGMSYASGIGLTANEETAINWFERAAANGEARSKNIVSGAWLYGDKDYGTEKKQLGIRYLVDLADAGETWAPKQIIEIYKDGTVSGIPVDYGKAVEYAAKYAEQGYFYAMSVLAEASDTARGPSASANYKDDSRAASLYNALLAHGDNDYIEISAMSLAQMYMTGRGVSKNNERAAECYQYASRLGNTAAKVALLDIYCQDLGNESARAEIRVIVRELQRSGNASINAAAVYALYCVEDAEEQYGKSMRYARQYILDSYAVPEKKASAQEYLESMEARISQMTDEERRVFLKEKKKLLDNPKAVKGLLLSVVAIVIILAAIFFSKSLTENQSNHRINETYDVTQTSHNESENAVTNTDVDFDNLTLGNFASMGTLDIISIKGSDYMTYEESGGTLLYYDDGAFYTYVGMVPPDEDNFEIIEAQSNVPCQVTNDIAFPMSLDEIKEYLGEDSDLELTHQEENEWVRESWFATFSVPEGTISFEWWYSEYEGMPDSVTINSSVRMEPIYDDNRVLDNSNDAVLADGSYMVELGTDDFYILDGHLYADAAHVSYVYIEDSVVNSLKEGDVLDLSDYDAGAFEVFFIQYTPGDPDYMIPACYDIGSGFLYEQADTGKWMLTWPSDIPVTYKTGGINTLRFADEVEVFFNDMQSPILVTRGLSDSYQELFEDTQIVDIRISDSTVSYVGLEWTPAIQEFLY